MGFMKWLQGDRDKVLAGVEADARQSAIEMEKIRRRQLDIAERLQIIRQQEQVLRRETGENNR